MKRLILIYNFCAGVSSTNLPREGVKALLINPFTSRPGELIKDSRATLVIKDSGGFDFKMAEKKGREISIDRSKKLMKTANRINHSPYHLVKHCEEVHSLIEPQSMDVLICLDFPVQDLSYLRKNNEQPNVEFLSKLGFNLVWAVETARQVEEAKSKNKLPGDLKLFLPIQCYNVEQFELFRHFISKEDIEFDGFSMPLRNVSLNEAALFVIRFYQLGIRRLHFLGVGNFKHIAFAAFLPKLIPLEWVSVDARSWYEHGKRMRYMDHNNFSVKHIDDINTIHCSCPYCQKRPHIVNVTNIRGITNKKINHELRSFISGHNFWVTEQLGHEISQRIDSIPKLERFLRERSSGMKNINGRIKDIDEICDALYFIKEYKDKDINYLMKVA